MATAASQHFTQKKSKILAELARPDAEYADLSPKGSVDEGIRELIDEINGYEGLVTTSSCAGRVAVFVEGLKALAAAAGEAADDEDSRKEMKKVRSTGVGGKAGGGRWLFVSHDPLGDGAEDWASVFGFGARGHDAGVVQLRAAEHEEEEEERRMIHFKFEPMILHILAASLDHAQLVLQAALSAGFRESGALNLRESPRHQATPMVAVRSMGLGFESMIGAETGSKRDQLVDGRYLSTLVQLSNERFVENSKRIERFRLELRRLVPGQGVNVAKQESEWEDIALRRERKRREGLERKAQLLQSVERPDNPEISAEEALSIFNHD